MSKKDPSGGGGEGFVYSRSEGEGRKLDFGQLWTVQLDQNPTLPSPPSSAQHSIPHSFAPEQCLIQSLFLSSAPT